MWLLLYMCCFKSCLLRDSGSLLLSRTLCGLLYLAIPAAACLEVRVSLSDMVPFPGRAAVGRHCSNLISIKSNYVVGIIALYIKRKQMIILRYKLIAAAAHMFMNEQLSYCCIGIGLLRSQWFCTTKMTLASIVVLFLFIYSPLDKTPIAKNVCNSHDKDS